MFVSLISLYIKDKSDQAVLKEDFEDIDQIFEKELWTTGIFNFSCDCEKVSSFTSKHALTCKDFQPKSCERLNSSREESMVY